MYPDLSGSATNNNHSFYVCLPLKEYKKSYGIETTQEPGEDKLRMGSGVIVNFVTKRKAPIISTYIKVGRLNFSGFIVLLKDKHIL